MNRRNCKQGVGVTGLSHHLNGLHKRVKERIDILYYMIALELMLLEHSTQFTQPKIQ